MSNYETFQTLLEARYVDLFATNPEYAYSAAHITPNALAVKMTAGLRSGAANKDGLAIKQVCKALGIKHTYTALQAYLG